MFDNIITRAVESLQTKIDGLDEANLVRLEESATLDFADWLELGDKSSRALLHGIIDADSAQTLYSIHTRFNGEALLAEKVVFIQAMGEILPRLR